MISGNPEGASQPRVVGFTGSFLILGYGLSGSTGRQTGTFTSSSRDTATAAGIQELHRLGLDNLSNYAGCVGLAEDLEHVTIHCSGFAMAKISLNQALGRYANVENIVTEMLRSNEEILTLQCNVVMVVALKCSGASTFSRLSCIRRVGFFYPSVYKQKEYGQTNL